MHESQRTDSGDNCRVTPRPLPSSAPRRVAIGAAVQSGRVHEHIPGNHSPMFLPVLQPTLRTGTEALTTAALAWLVKDKALNATTLAT